MMRSMISMFSGTPDLAPFKSTTWIQVAPISSKAWAWATGSSLYTVTFA